MEKENETCLKIAIVGSESTGKTTLAEQLSRHYNTPYVHEYAREFLEPREGVYGEEDLVDIAKGQIRLEQKIVNQGEKLLICDTNVLAIKIWSDFKYGRCDQWIQEEVTKLTHHFYFLMDIDVPWESDKLRENAASNDRLTLRTMHEKELENQGFSFLLLSGTKEKRFTKAVDVIDRMLKNYK